MSTMAQPLGQRFWTKVEFSVNCWEWQGYRMRGYGQFALTRRKTVRAHRLAYELMVGPIPDGLTLDHLCRNKACVNPAHLEPVTSQENVRRSPNAPSVVNAKATHCRHNHELSGTNLIIRPNGNRDCRECGRLRQAKHRARLAEAV